MFKLQFETDNAAFEDGLDQEVSRILADVKALVDGGWTGGRVRDVNGNTVGSWELS